MAKRWDDSILKFYEYFNLNVGVFGVGWRIKAGAIIFAWKVLCGHSITTGYILVHNLNFNIKLLYFQRFINSPGQRDGSLAFQTTVIPTREGKYYELDVGISREELHTKFNYSKLYTSLSKSQHIVISHVW